MIMLPVLITVKSLSLQNTNYFYINTNYVQPPNSPHVMLHSKMQIIVPIYYKLCNQRQNKLWMRNRIYSVSVPPPAKLKKLCLRTSTSKVKICTTSLTWIFLPPFEVSFLTVAIYTCWRTAKDGPSNLPLRRSGHFAAPINFKLNERQQRVDAKTKKPKNKQIIKYKQIK